MIVSHTFGIDSGTLAVAHEHTDMTAAEAHPQPKYILLVTSDDALLERFNTAVPGDTSLSHTRPEQALGSVRESVPTVVIVDMGGFAAGALEACRQLADWPDLRTTPLVAFLGVDHGLTGQALEAGATDCLSGPEDGEWLIHRLKQLVDNAQRQAGLRLELERYRAVLNAVPDMVFHVDREGIILQFRPGQGVQPTVPSDQLLGRNVSDLVPAAVAEEARAVLDRPPHGGCPETHEYSLDTEHGRRDFEARVVATDSGTIMGLVRDITQSKRAESALRDSEARLLAAQRMARLGHWEVDVRSGQYWCSVEAADMLDVDAGANPTAFWRILHPDDRTRVLSTMSKTLEEEIPYDLEFRVRHSDGTICHIHSVAEALPDATGEPCRLSGTLLDVTERKRVEEALRESERLLATHLRHTPLAAIAWDTEFRVTQWNPAAETVFGYTRAEVMGQNAADLIVPLRLRTAIRSVYDDLIAQRGGYRSTNANITKDGREILCEWYNTPLTAEDGRVIGVASLVEDVTERETAAQRLRENEARLDHLAHHDALTSLPNRLLFQDRLEQAMRACHRSGKQAAVLLLDLDRFKYINDSLGHATGDRFLRRIAGRLRAVIRETDTVARLGGDEFVVVMEGLTDPGGAATLAEKLLLSIASPVTLGQHELYSSASIGVSIYPQDGSSVDELLQCADMAMYQAKGTGRNLFKFYTPDMNRRTQQVLRTERDLRRALEQGQLTVHYQPQLDLQDRRIVAVEALVRWQHPERGMVCPGEFIALAEESGLIVPMGESVLREACAQNRVWQQQPGWKPVKVAVNLSALQFQRPELVETVATVLADTGLPPRYLELELTESSIMSDPTAACEVLRALDGMGVQLAIDDFGTGYSSLSHLKRFPLHRLKIDRSFVAGVTTDANDAAIARAIIALARSMSLEVVAEGVETEQQRLFLQREGCQHGQGNLFGAASTAEQVDRFLRPAAARDLQRRR
ncbi:MAG: EAL domain-containing protein [Gammaproteobacteria bacterium]|nr:EAL domain-containing protein [Gammaproteobacteria bacterium]MDJ0891152.1 EAL domain-containing protein [Gammaproteobacteria bacterium]